MKKVTLVDYDDWSGLYIDGKLITEGHEVTIHEFAKALGIEIEDIEAKDWLGEEGSLPDTLEEVIKKNEED